MVRLLIFQVLFLAFFVAATPVFASRPGGGSEGPDQCTVMGVVTQIKENNTAVVRLKEVSGSTTYEGCNVTGAAKMAEANTPATVPLDVQPRPVIAVGDVVFVNIRSDRDVAIETFPPGEYTLDTLLKEVQIFYDNRLERLQMIYAIKSFLGVPQVVEQLVPELISEDKEKRLSAALLLIVLADAKQTVPPDMLQQALRIGLMESRQSAVGSSIGLYPGDKAQVVNVLIGVLNDKEVVDPFATIVAMGEIGEEAARALPDAIDRINQTGLNQMRSDGDKIFATAVEKMKAQDKAVKIFMQKVNDGKLKDKEGPLAKGMCRLKTDNADLAKWCRDSNAAPPNACPEAIAKFDKFLAARPNTCTKDDDCDGYYFPVGAPECPPAHFLPKSSMTEEVKEGTMKFQALIKFSCAQEWENKAAVCSPPPYKAGCRDGKCVDVK